MSTTLAGVMAMCETAHHHPLAMPDLAAVLSNHQAWLRFKADLDARGASPRTVHVYRVPLFDFWHQLAKRKRQWHRARPADYTRYLERRCKPGTRNAGQALARNTRAHYSSRILRFYSWATQTGLLTRNPLAGCVPARWAAHRPRALRLEQVAKALELLDGRERVMCALGYYQMLRVGEMARLSVEDVHLTGRVPLIRIQGKGGYEDWMDVTPALVPILRAYLAIRPPSGPLLENYARPGAHLSPDYCARLLARALRGLVGDSGHALRHTGATELAVATGDNVYVVQQALRHRTLKATQVYLKRRPGVLAPHLGKLPDPLKAEEDAWTKQRKSPE